MDMTILNSLIGNTLIPAAEKMTFSYVTAVVITGLSVVFLGLIVLIVFVWAFGKIFTGKKSTPPPAKQTSPKKQAAAPSAAKSQTAAANKNDDDIIAVIAAAVAAMGESEGKNYRLRSVKAVKNKPSRSVWSMAGIQNNTNPF